MSALANLQEKVYNNYKGRGNKQEFLDGVDPTVWPQIAQILADLVFAIQDCLVSESVDVDLEAAEEIVNEPTWLQRRLVTIRTRRNLGWFGFRRNGGPDLVEAILEEGRNLSKDELDQILTSEVD